MVISDILMESLWEAVFRLERMGLAVLTLTCDEASFKFNRRLWKPHSSIMRDELEQKVPHVLLQGALCTSFVIHHTS